MDRNSCSSSGSGDDNVNRSFSSYYYCCYEGSDERTDSDSEAEYDEVSNNVSKTIHKNGEKLHQCVGCGYESERKSNVNRHYKRIHVTLRKPKVCFCGEKFATKGEFYLHNQKDHPCNRQSTFVVQEKYKIGKSQQPTANKENTRVRLGKIVKRSGARVLTNLTNGSVTSESSDNYGQMDSDHMYSSHSSADLDALGRDYLSEIDFDELDAILNLSSLKRSF